MKYYLVIQDRTRKAIGKHYGQTSEVYDIPLIEGVPYIRQLEGLPNYHGCLTNDTFPNFEPRILFRLKEGAKLTDSVSIPNMNAYGLFVSEKFKDLLTQFKLIEHRFYPGHLLVGEDVYKYYWFHPLANFFECLILTLQTCNFLIQLKTF